MKKILSLKNRGLSDIFIILALIFGVINLILYLNFGATIFNPKLSGSVTGSLISIIVISSLALLLNSKLLKYATFLVYLYSFVEYINTQVTYITNIFVGIDNTEVTSSFICLMIFFVLGLAFSLVSGILSKDEIAVYRGESYEKNI